MAFPAGIMHFLSKKDPVQDRFTFTRHVLLQQPWLLVETSPSATFETSCARPTTRVLSVHHDKRGHCIRRSFLRPVSACLLAIYCLRTAFITAQDEGRRVSRRPCRRCLCLPGHHPARWHRQHPPPRRAPAERRLPGRRSAVVPLQHQSRRRCLLDQGVVCLEFL